MCAYVFYFFIFFLQDDLLITAPRSVHAINSEAEILRRRKLHRNFIFRVLQKDLCFFLFFYKDDLLIYGTLRFVHPINSEAEILAGVDMLRVSFSLIEM